MAERRLRLDRTLGPQVITWIESSLCHGPGDVQGQPLQLDDEQVSFLLRAYEIDDKGRRVIRRAVLSRPKGRAKSEIAAAIADAELLGPVRFRGWDHDGTPLGGPVKAPYIPCCATEEGQAGNVYDAAAFMLREGAVSMTAGLDVGLTRTFTAGGGKMVAFSAKASSKDGGKETFAVFDETHLYSNPELHRLHNTIRRNLAKRKIAEPWSLETSTMYVPGEESVAESSHQYAQAVKSGALTDTGFLFDHREGPDLSTFDFTDDDQLRAALTIAYGEAAEWMDFERLIAEARDPQTLLEDFVRFFLNRPMRKGSTWLDTTEFDACADLSIVVPDGANVVLGFDGSYNRDATALVGWLLGPVPHLFTIKVWERPERAAKDWVVDRDDVNLEVDRAMQRYRVRRLVCDRARWGDEINEWARRYGEDDDGPVVNFPSSSIPKISYACSLMYGAVKGKTFTHDGNPVVRRHFSNAVVKETRDGAYITKDGRNSPRKIDAAMAAVMSYDTVITADDLDGGDEYVVSFASLYDDAVPA